MPPAWGWNPHKSNGASAERLPAVESRNPTVRATATYLQNRFGDLHQIQFAEQLDFDLDGQRQLVQVTPFKDAYLYKPSSIIFW